MSTVSSLGEDECTNCGHSHGHFWDGDSCEPEVEEGGGDPSTLVRPVLARYVRFTLSEGVSLASALAGLR
jgi:hypothetical protein